MLQLGRVSTRLKSSSLPIGSMYGIYANIGGILMVNVTIYIACMDPMGIHIYIHLFMRLCM